MFSVSPADEVSAITAEVSGVFGGWEGSRSPAGVERGTDAAQIQHGPHPCAQRVPSTHMHMIFY